MPESPKQKKGPKKPKSSSASKDGSSAVITDPRFANIQSDPRYRLPSKRHTHVKLDKRFAHMLQDEDFSRNAPVDRYGRKLKRDDTKKQLQRFYRLEESEEEDDDDVGSVDDDDEVQKELQRVEKRGHDPARDGGFSSSSSDEESSSEEEDEEEVEDAAEEIKYPNQGQSDIPLGEVTKRIAIVNLDWDNIRAEDLMAVISSFLPPGGRTSKVAVYPSEFGKQRMEREEMEGPPKEIFAAKKGNDDEEDSEFDEEEELDEEEEDEKIKQSILKEDQGEEFDSTHLRKYQLERLRYFYAVLTFSSKEAAKHVYDAVDGTEYMSSANFFDLRFVPDDTDFTEDTPRDECERLPDGYKPSDFVTDALQHSKVKLTWDADDSTRKDAQERAFKGGRKEIDENDLKAYLGSDSSDDEEEEGGVEVVDTTAGDGVARDAPAPKLGKKEAERARMRALLGLPDKPANKPKASGPVGEMEITFSAGLSSAPAKGSVFANEPEKDESIREKYIRKEKERKQRRKEKMKAVRDGEEPADAEDKQDENEVSKPAEEDLGFDDPFFTAPELDAAAASKQRKAERKKKREEREADEAATAAQRAELELLMVDDKSTSIKHFDMTEIEKAEKKAKKAGKKKKGKRVVETTQADDFKLDVQDARFEGLFESHEFAIDPTNPRFKPTQGMNALLEEGRKRRRHGHEEETDRAAEEPGRKKKKQASSQQTGDIDDLNKLVERVKGKTKKAS
ncbi:hypothetical protein AJ80_01406 [Polytolypa hystricis UAMH7299]|uniref:Uncharacterized protein n=1 Tax=Polytolypa hystricis (strain UAMH7299) TaxID=1447883 RepID=A0A2B7Z1W7_POLH7|nr:hypothetical protein AJ80_01406 [Polytolypa hystricis UAMH7299]